MFLSRFHIRGRARDQMMSNNQTNVQCVLQSDTCLNYCIQARSVGSAVERLFRDDGKDECGPFYADVSLLNLVDWLSWR